MKRRIAYAAAVAVALFATGAGLFLLLNGPGRAFLRRQVELQLADLLEGEVRIGEVELILARGLGLRGRDVRVYPYGEGYGMRADVVEVELREWGLATADLELALLEIEGFAMRATLDEKGTWSFPPLRALQAEEEPEEAEEEWQEPVLAVVHGFERVSRYLLEDERIADVIVITDAHVEFIDRSLDARMREGMALQRFQLSEASARLDRPWLRGGGSLGIAGVVVGPAGRTVPVTHSAHVDANGIHGSFQIGELDLDVLDGYVQSAWARNADLDGTVRAEVKLDSPREGYVVVRLEAELENFIPTIVVADDPVPLELPIDQASATLEVEPGVARILESRVRGPRLAAGVTGRIERPIAASSLAHLDLRIEGADLDDVTPLVRQLPRRTVEAIVEWFDRLESGTCEKLRVSGTTELAEWGELAGGELRRLPRNFVMSLRVADVTARLEDGDAIEGGAFEVDWTADRMQLRRGSGIWRGEPLAEIDLTVDGFSKFVGLTEPTRRVAAEPTPGARLLWDILVPDDPDPEATPIRFEVEIDYLEHPILRWAIEDASVVVTPTVTGSDAQVLGASWGGQPVVAEILYQVEPPRLVVGLEAVDEVPKPVDFLAEGTSQGEGEWGRGRFRLEPYEPREGEEPDMLSNMAGEFVLVGSQLRVEPFELQLSSKVTANARIALELGSKVEVGVDLEGQFSDTSCDGLAQLAGLPPGFVTGEMDAFLDVDGAIRPDEPLLADLHGTLVASAEDGEIRQKLPLAASLAAATDGFNPFAKREAVEYESLEADLGIRGGLLTARRIEVEGPVRVYATGTADLLAETQPIDAVVGVFLAQKVREFLGHVPLVSWVVPGSDRGFVGAYFRVSGAADDPEVRSMPMKTIREGMPALLSAPIDVIEWIFTRGRPQRKDEAETRGHSSKSAEAERDTVVR